VAPMTSDSQALAQRLRTQIRVHGAMPFDRFMQACLYDPESGYYTSGSSGPGRAGDFYTSVSVGPLFGRLLGDAFAACRPACQTGDCWDLVEQGAHGGDLCADILNHLRQTEPEAYGGCRYWIVEPSPVLQERQLKKISTMDHADRVRWVASLDEIAPGSLSGIFFSNELLDSFPVSRVTFRVEGWQEGLVELDDADRFVWGERACSDGQRDRIRALGLPEIPGYTAELSPLAEQWMGAVARVLRHGFVFTIDYGGLSAELYDVEKSGGTLRAYRQHRQDSDVLQLPGSQDLTAHVNFTSLIETGQALGLRRLEFTDQHHFLVRLGTLGFFKELEQTAASGGLSPWLSAYKTLMHPESMGALFKVLVQGRGDLSLPF